MYIFKCPDSVVPVLKIMLLYHLGRFVILYFKAVSVKHGTDLRI